MQLVVEVFVLRHEENTGTSSRYSTRGRKDRRYAGQRYKGVDYGGGERNWYVFVWFRGGVVLLMIIPSVYVWRIDNMC